MIEMADITAVSDLKILNFIVNHKNPPNFVGFIVNYPKSRRYIEIKKLKELFKINKKKTLYVAVLVNPKNDILEEIKDLPFDYYQLYDCSVDKIKSIKNKYKKKIITVFTIKDFEDLKNHNLYKDVTDIYLFDSKGYEKSMSFDHRLIENIKIDKDVMLAGNIQVDDDLENYKKIADIIDISGGLETSGLKDLTKIEIFLKKVKQIKNET